MVLSLQSVGLGAAEAMSLGPLSRICIMSIAQIEELVNRGRVKAASESRSAPAYGVGGDPSGLRLLCSTGTSNPADSVALLGEVSDRALLSLLWCVGIRRIALLPAAAPWSGDARRAVAGEEGAGWRTRRERGAGARLCGVLPFPAAVLGNRADCHTVCHAALACGGRCRRRGGALACGSDGGPMGAAPGWAAGVLRSFDFTCTGVCGTIERSKDRRVKTPGITKPRAAGEPAPGAHSCDSREARPARCGPREPCAQ